MPADNPKCHKKGCQCATCFFICSRCLVAGRCSDEICSSEHGMQNCEFANSHKGSNKMNGGDTK